MPFALTKPYFLLIWLFIPLIWIMLNRSSLRDQPLRRRILIGGLRSCLVLLLGLALSHPRLIRGSDRVNLFFCLDLSDSIGASGKEKALAFMRKARSGMQEDDQAGLIVFGKQPSIEIGPKKDFDLEAIQSQVDSHFTDISKALESAMARLPENGMNRIVLFSDGNENLGQALEMANLASSMGMEIYPVPLDSWFKKNEVFVQELWTPSMMPIETPFDIRLIIMSTNRCRTDLILLRNGKVLTHKSLDLHAGKNVHGFVDSLERPGLYHYKAVVNASSDSVFENNTGSSFTQASKRPQVLYVREGDGLGPHLTQALRYQGLDVVEKQPDDLPQSIKGLVDYSAIILQDVPASAFSMAFMELFERYVKDIGGGLVMIGGDRSFGTGLYLDTPVERALPVFMDVPTKVEFPGLCLVFVIDKSSSMGGRLTAQNKLQGAKRAVFSAVELLNPFDKVGILAFDTTYHWTVSITQAKERRKIAQELSRLREGGGTDLLTGLEEAFRILQQVSSVRKHVIALSDGLTVKGDFSSLIHSMREEKITVSTVAVGGDADRILLSRIAEWGGGRSYYTDDEANIPRIFTGETKIAARKLIVEKDLQPYLVTENEITSGIPGSAFPKVRGFVLTYPKPGAQILLRTDEGPILITWQYGLGRSVAFTSDLAERWGKDWVLWSHYGKFVSQMVKWAQRKESPRRFAEKIVSKGGEGTFTVDVTDDENRYVNWLDLKLKALLPSGRSRTVSLDQIAPGKYRGDFPAGERGEYYLTLFGEEGDGSSLQPQTYGYGKPYAAEYEKTGVNHALLEKLASISKGEVLNLDADPGKLFSSDSTAKAHGEEIWPYLVLAGLVLLIIDVAARKLPMLSQRSRQNALL